jgi:hypothetical protein
MLTDILKRHYLDDQITGFPLLAKNVITRQNVFSIKPSVGEISDTGFNRRMTYYYDLEINQPWYYSTSLTDDNIKVEYVPGEKTGIPIYTITSPVFEKVSLYLSNGKKFTIIANKSSKINKYIQSARLNVKELTSPRFSHEDLLKGGTLYLKMGEKPGKLWSGI